jgi:hypothetical protein
VFVIEESVDEYIPLFDLSCSSSENRSGQENVPMAQLMGFKALRENQIFNRDECRYISCNDSVSGNSEETILLW